MALTHGVAEEKEEEESLEDRTPGSLHQYFLRRAEDWAFFLSCLPPLQSMGWEVNTGGQREEQVSSRETSSGRNP